MAVTGTTLAARQYRSREAGLRGRLLPDEFLALERDPAMAGRSGRNDAFVETATLEADAALAARDGPAGSDACARLLRARAAAYLPFCGGEVRTSAIWRGGESVRSGGGASAKRTTQG